MLRSPLPHAGIVRIDTARAGALKGVHAVLTADDVPDARYGVLVLDMGIFMCGKVRYIGEAVAAVAAVDEETAARAVDLIEVAYEALPAVFDPLEALRPDAPIVHEALAGCPALFERTARAMAGNVNYHAEIACGDVEAGFAVSDFVFEDIYQRVWQRRAAISRPTRGLSATRCRAFWKKAGIEPARTEAWKPKAGLLAFLQSL